MYNYEYHLGAYLLLHLLNYIFLIMIIIYNYCQSALGPYEPKTIDKNYFIVVCPFSSAFITCCF